MFFFKRKVSRFLKARGSAARGFLFPRGKIIFLSAALILLVRGMGNCPARVQAAENNVPRLKIYLFASSTCEECKALKEEFIPAVLRPFGNKAGFEHIPVDDAFHFELLLLYERFYGVDSEESVKLFIGRRCLAGIRSIRQNLEAAVRGELARQSRTITPEEIIAARGAEESLLEERFRRFNAWAVAGAGLIDGVNPCAFVTLVFFISALSFYGRRKKEILLAGVTFACAMFITYLLLGLGMMRAVKILSVHLGISRIIGISAAALAFVLSALHLRDVVFLSRGGKAQAMSVRLPPVIRARINRLLSCVLRTRSLIFWTALAGAAIALLESLCTGQVYLPAIIYIIGDERLSARALFYLVVYNAMFIVPLLAVFACAYFGVSSQRITAFFSRHMRLAKLLLTVLFLGLGTGLLVQLK